MHILFSSTTRLREVINWNSQHERSHPTPIDGQKGSMVTCRHSNPQVMNRNLQRTRCYREMEKINGKMQHKRCHPTSINRQRDEAMGNCSSHAATQPLSIERTDYSKLQHTRAATQRLHTAFDPTPPNGANGVLKTRNKLKTDLTQDGALSV